MSRLVKGFRDISGQEAIKRKVIREIIINKLELYGFEPAETPIVEYEDFVKGNNDNDEVISDIFKLRDKGNRKLALRYEFTFQLKRLSENKKLPYKRYQIGEVFRDEPTSSNRFRQFVQCDFDIVGSDLHSEAEILLIVKEILSAVNIKNTIYVNHKSLLDEILNKNGISKKESVLREIDKIDKLSKEEVFRNLKKLNAEKLLDLFKKDNDYFKSFNSYSEIGKLREICALYGVEFKFSPSLVRGLSYYTGMIFEIKSSMKESIGAGGSYKINGIDSTGGSFGLDRMASIADISLNSNLVMVISLGEDEAAVLIAKRLRENNIPCILMIGKPSKSLEYANSRNIKNVIFVGEKEVSNQSYTLKNLETGKEIFLKEKDLILTMKNNIETNK